MTAYLGAELGLVLEPAQVLLVLVGGGGGVQGGLGGASVASGLVTCSLKQNRMRRHNTDGKHESLLLSLKVIVVMRPISS